MSSTHTIRLVKMQPLQQSDNQEKRPSLAGRIILGVNAVLLVAFAVLLVWDYHTTFDTYVREKQVALDEEAEVLLAGVMHLRPDGTKEIQDFIDQACGAMQETTSPGHHIAIETGLETLQARAHHRASPEILSSLRAAARSENGRAPFEDEWLVVGSASAGDTRVYVSEYLSNIRRIARGQLVGRAVTVVLVAVVLGVTLNILFFRLVSIPLGEMMTVVRRFGRGERRVRIRPVRTRELGIFADEFNTMAEALGKAEEERRIRLEKARRIQNNLLPSPREAGTIRTASLFCPATEVAGDYYDVMELNDGDFLLCIADVVGHDVPAAMSAAMLKAVLNMGVGAHITLPQLMISVHTAFAQVTLMEDFATMVLARWRPRTRTLTYVSAGHEIAYLSEGTDGLISLESTGPILGIRGFMGWPEKTLHVPDRERLVMITDGVTEMLSREGEPFGQDRLEQILKDTRSLPLEALSDRLMTTLTEFRGGAPQNDDATMLAVEL